MTNQLSSYHTLHWLALLLLFLNNTACSAEQGPADVPPLLDLHASALQAQAQRLPIMLVFATTHCPYCHQVREDFIRPLMQQGELSQRVIVRWIDVDLNRSIKDWQGNPTDYRRLAAQYGVSFYPTLLFIDAQGKELTERLIGISNEEFYAAYLESRMQQALSKLRR